MNRVKTLLFALVLVVMLAGVASADLTTDTLGYWSMDAVNVSGSNVYDLTGNGRTLLGGGMGTPNQTGIINQAILFNGVDQYLTGVNSPYAFISESTDWSASAWFWTNETPSTASQAIMCNTNGVNDRNCFYLREGKVSIAVYDGTFATDGSNTTYTLGAWQHAVVTHSSADVLRVYLNGVNVSGGGATQMNGGERNFTIGAADDGSFIANFNGTLDEIGVFDVVLTPEQVLTLYNSGSGVQYPYAGNTISIDGVSPPDETGYNTSNVTFQVNTTSTENYTARLYINGTLNHTSATLTTGTYSYNHSVVFADGNWTYHWYVEQVSNPDANATSSTNSFFIDTVSPDISMTTPSTIFPDWNGYYNNFTTNITLSDANLYSWYINITYLNGTLVANYSNSSLTGFTQVNLTQLISTPLAQGVLNFTIDVYDGHTQQRIDPIPLTTNNRTFAYDTLKENIGIRDTQNRDVTRIFDTKHTDRHKFGFEYNTSRTSATYEVTSAAYIDILHDKTLYKGHLVIGTKWVDFENDNVKRIIVERVTDNKVLVHVEYTSPTSIVEFNSIGVLNRNTVSTLIYNIATTTTYTDPIIVGSTQEYTLNLSFNSTYVDDYESVQLFLNGTSHAATASITSTQYHYSVNTTVTGNVSHYWQFTLKKPTLGFVTPRVTYNTSTQTQSSIVIFVDDCSVFTTKFLELDFRDEQTNVEINASISYLFTYGIGTYTNTYNNSVASTGNATFCFTPAYANFTTDILLEYTSAGYTPRNYVVNSMTADNSTNYVTLYLLSTANGTLVTFHVVDSADNDLQNILIETYRYDIGTNTDILVDTETTDPVGNAVLDLQANDQLYSFKFYREGDLALSTIRFKIFDTLYEWRLQNTTNNPLAEWLNVQDTGVVTYDNNTNIVTYTFGNASQSTEYCLRVTANNTDYYYACAPGSGTLNYTITTFNLTYYAQGTVTTKTGLTFLLSTLTIDTTYNIRTLIGAGLAAFLLMIIYLFFALLVLPYNKNLPVIIAVPVALVLAWMNILPGGMATVAGITAGALIALYILNK